MIWLNSCPAQATGFGSSLDVASLGISAFAGAGQENRRTGSLHLGLKQNRFQLNSARTGLSEGCGR